ncbi:hypothetical protein CBOM_02472 [Ceraceosorus bombacis]|uniref:Uncharacterized protein n=1 Tax=Ceraceosorus bombacis TaxID=401625 RepID=A0A0P1BER7_9BASI|nr:hypothetical protein CBOM_02472 [Ceraceosorus bombacis]
MAEAQEVSSGEEAISTQSFPRKGSETSSTSAASHNGLSASSIAPNDSSANSSAVDVTTPSVSSRSSRLSSLEKDDSSEALQRIRKRSSLSRAGSPRSRSESGFLAAARTQEKGIQSGETRSSALPVGALSAGFLAKLVQGVVDSLEDRLENLASRPDWIGTAASLTLERGYWIEDRIAEEEILRREAIGGIDNMWLLLSDTTSSFNPVCTATFVFKEPPTLDNIKEALKVQSDLFPKYKQKLANVGRKWHGAHFVDDPDWNVNRHVSIQRLPEPAGKKELEEYTARFIAKDWDFDKPLWESVIFDNFVDAQRVAKGAMVTRGHHTLTDGQGFCLSLLSATSFRPELERLLNDGASTLRLARRGRAKPSKLHKALKPLDKFQNTLFLQLAMLALFWSMWIVSLVADAYGSIEQGLVIGFWWLFTAWRQRYATTTYHGPRVKGKEFSTSKAFEMDDIKTIQKAFSGPTPGGIIDQISGRRGKYISGHITLNDVLCTVIADAIIDEMDDMDEDPAHHPPGLFSWIQRSANALLPSRIALMIPISIRPISNTSMSNWSTGSIAYLPCGSAKEGLPTGAKAMHRRLKGNSRALNTLKRGWLPTLSFWAIQLTGQAPILYPSALWTPVSAVVRWCLEFTLCSFTAVLTNVPGPPGEVHLAESEVVQWTASPPQAGKSTLGIGIISFNKRCCVTIVADHVVGCPSEGVADRITHKVERRFTQYLEVARDILNSAEKKKKRRESNAAGISN